jgi:hypothetical protein
MLGVPYDRQKLSLYYERGKVPKADLFLSSGTKYWHVSTVQNFCEKEEQRLSNKGEFGEFVPIILCCLNRVLN